MYLCNECKNIARIESSGLLVAKHDYHCQIHGHIDPAIRCVNYEKGEPREREEN